MPLTDTQLRLLSAASQHSEGLLIPPERLVGGARAKVAATLLRQRLVTDVATRGDTAWRATDDGRGRGLRITAAGLAALGIEPEDTKPDDPQSDNADAQPGTASAANSAASPRAGSKAALVLALLTRPQGATLAELAAATGWLPHTTRAALTGLRHKGHSIRRERDAHGRSTYRLAQAQAQG